MDMNTENLISLVFARPPLWDKSSKLYRNKHIIEKLWTQVAELLRGGATSETAKKKWKGIRDTFGKELRKVPEPRSGDEGPLNFETYTSWPHFESMLFLKDQMRPRKSGGNLSAAGGGDIGDDVNEEQDEYQAQRESESVVELVPESSDAEVESQEETLPQAVRRPLNRPVKRSAQQQLIEIEARKLRLLEKKATRSNPESEDEDLSFFKSLLPHVHKLKPEEKLDFRMEVQGVVQKYVYKKAHSYAMQRTPLRAENSFSNQLSTQLPGISPLPGTSRQSTPIGSHTGAVLLDYENSRMEIENQYATVETVEREYYTVITSPISSVVSRK